MKQRLKTSFVFFCLLLCATSFAQTKCTIKNRSLTNISETQNINVSYFSENLATQQMFCLNFKNTGTTTITFSFSLKDKNGVEVSSQALTLAPGQSVNGIDDPNFNKSMVVLLREEQTTSDFSVQLNF